MAMTLTGMATVLPVRIAVLMISVSCREGGALMSWGAYGALFSQDTPAMAQAPGCPAPYMHVPPLGHAERCLRQVSFAFSDAVLTWSPAVAFRRQPFPSPPPSSFNI